MTTTITVYIWLTELMFNLVAPLATIVFNVLVIRALFHARRTRGRDLSCSCSVTLKDQKTPKTSTTLMLLSVSFFYVVTTLPMTFVYVLHPVFLPGNDHMTDEQVGCTARFLRLYTGVVLVRYKQHLLRYLEWSTVGLSLEFLTRASGRHAMRKMSVFVYLSVCLSVRHTPVLGASNNNTNNNNSKTMFMVLSSWQSHCESSPGSFDDSTLWFKKKRANFGGL